MYSAMLALLLLTASALTPGPNRLIQPTFCERCYLRSGSAATSFSATFDVDLERFETADGFLAYASVLPLATTIAYFDPVLADPTDKTAARTLLREFLRVHPRTAFLHCGPLFAATLADEGLLINPYGVENKVPLPLSLRGTRMRGLRREVDAARRQGVSISVVADALGNDDALWAELRSVDARWISGRVQQREVKRATRRAVLGPECHTTKVVARTQAGEAVGWACFDHIYEDGQVVGLGLAVVRSDPCFKGVSTLLAVDGARLCAAVFPRLCVLDLGVSPLAPVPDGMDWNPLIVCGEEVCVEEPERAPFIDALFSSLFRWGTGLYNTQGLAAWKRKWRPKEGLAYVGVQSALPVRELVAALLLLVI